MPRQLPWQKAAGSRTQIKQTPRPAKKQRVLSDIDDDFFAGTVLEPSRKGKERAEPREDLDDDDDDELPTTTTLHDRNTTNREPKVRSRAPSSSPPPVAANLPSPQVEYMDKGTSKFDLRDDEWMMVEDEFLQTAKLFTQHLHLAEYERMRKTIDEKKKNAEISRPVIPNAKLSDEGRVKSKLVAQEKKQRKAIRDVITSVRDEEEDSDTTEMRPAQPDKSATSSTGLRRAAPTTPRRALGGLPKTGNASDSDDLDAIPHYKSTLPRHNAPTPSQLQPKDPQPLQSVTTYSRSTTFAKPPVPPFPSSNPRSTRTNRVTPFDMLDNEYTSRKPHTSPSLPTKQNPKHQPKTTSNSRLSALPPANQHKEPSSNNNNTYSSELRKAKATMRPIDLFDELDVGTRRISGLSKETSDRLAKRKANKDWGKEKDKEDKGKKRSVALDDIPTFLF